MKWNELKNENIRNTVKETNIMNKTTLKLLLGLSIATAATAIIAIGVIHELKSMRELKVDTDELPEGLDNNVELTIE